MTITNREYRTEINGLRAIAVLAVIITHMSKSVLPGGFLGVDVFFVISGFVITGSLASLPSQSLAGFFSHFFERRIKRLLPALLACVILTSAAICVVDPKPQTSIATGLFSLFGVSNIFLWNISSDYFARAAQANAFTQTWSLGVEEQFYLIFPLVAWFAGYVKTGRTSRLMAVMCALSMTSLICFVVLGVMAPNAAFYLMPARIWELGAGCMLFLAMRNRHIRNVDALAGHQTIAYLLVLIALFFVPPIYSTMATVGVVATTLLLIAGTAPNTVVAAILNQPLLQYLGKISYSLYLWHWSVLCLSKWLIGNHAIALAVLAVVMLLFASASYHLIERPLRAARWSNRAGISAGIGLGVAALTTGIVLLALPQHESLLRKQSLALEGAPAFLPLRASERPYDPTCTVDGQQRLLLPSAMDDCTIAPTKAGGATVWAMGDSHAGHLQGMLYSLHDRTGLGVHLIETPGVVYPLNAPFEPRMRIVEAILARAKPGDILLLSRIYLDRSEHAVLGDVTAWGAKLGPLAAELEKKGLKLAIVGPSPIFSYEDVRTCYFSTFGINPCMEDRYVLRKSVSEVNALLATALTGTSNASVFHPFDTLCPPADRMCSPIRDGKFMYRDKDHLNVRGSAMLTKPFITFLESQSWISASTAWEGSFRTIDFKNANLSNVTTKYFSNAEAWGRWTDNFHPTVSLETWIPQRFHLTMTTNGCFRTVVGKNVSVRIAGQMRSFVCEAGPQVIELDFDPIGKGVDTIAFDIPDAASIKDLQLGNDTRKLGLALGSLTISPARTGLATTPDAPVPAQARKLADWDNTPRSVEFKNATMQNVTVEHVSSAEAWGRWTDSTRAALTFNSALPQQLQMTLSINECFRSVVGKTVIVRAGGQVRSFVCGAGAQDIDLEFDRFTQPVDTISLDIPDAKSPRDLKLGDDTRQLGIALVKLTVRPLTGKQAKAQNKAAL